MVQPPPSLTSALILVLGFLSTVAQGQAQCGAGTPDAKVESSGSSFRATRGTAQVYSGTDYRAAIQAALDAITPGQRVVVIASGSIGAGTITLASGKIFEGCGTINVGNRAGRGAIESTNTNDVQIPYLTMTGNPYFGLRFSGVKNLSLGKITMNLSGGLGIRFDRDLAPSANVKMDMVNVTGAGSHAVETWNIDGLTIGIVVARDVGECGLLLQGTTNAKVGSVEGVNVAKGNGYATLRFANNNGQVKNGAGGGYGTTNVFVEKVVSRGGGRGIFCVSRSGAAEIGSVELVDNGNNAILIENCYNIRIKGGKVTGGGEVRLSARSEFPNNKDIWINLDVSGTSVRESPCGENTNWELRGSGGRNIC